MPVTFALTLQWRDMQCFAFQIGYQSIEVDVPHYP